MRHPRSLARGIIIRKGMYVNTFYYSDGFTIVLGIRAVGDATIWNWVIDDTVLEFVVVSVTTALSGAELNV